MPLSEFLLKTTKSKPGTTQSKMSNFSSSPFYMPDHEFTELLWENGQIVLRDHSSRPKKNSDKSSEKESIVDSSRNPQINATDSLKNNFLDNREEDIVPWINNFPISDENLHNNLNPLQNNFCSDFFEEFAGTNLQNAEPKIDSGSVAKTDSQVVDPGLTGLTSFSLFTKPVTMDRVRSSEKASTTSARVLNLNDVNDNDINSNNNNNKNNDDEKKKEVLVAPSSVCSVSSAGDETGDPKQGEKRKIREQEESSSNNSDGYESVGAKKNLSGRGAKRSRAAQVHNLSERRRRERINEKMRALQELIPNCSKADKASMLEDAIEYLKTLQLQVQIMSMSSGMYMPPLMLQPGMQPMRAPSPMAHLGYGLGMGMGMGYGLGMYNMHGSPVLPVPPLHPQQFQLPPSAIPGPLPGLHGLVGPVNPPVAIPARPGQQLGFLGDNGAGANLGKDSVSHSMSPAQQKKESL